MDSILNVLEGAVKLVSHRDVIVFALGLLVGWHVPAPAWAIALWDKITKKAPVVDTAATVAVAATSTVAAEVTNVVDAVQSVEAVVAPAVAATTTSTTAAK
jgi:hypothetical protein